MGRSGCPEVLELLRAALDRRERPHTCRENFGAPCRCDDFNRFVTQHIARMLAAESPEVRLQGERLLRCLSCNMAGMSRSCSGCPDEG